MPLRPELYSRLANRFPGGVMIASEGLSMRATVTWDGTKKSLQVVDPGEYYRINCPFCYESRHRLWINHMWGKQSETGLNLFLAHCYNETQCMSQPGNAWALYQRVFNDVRLTPDVDVVLPGQDPGPAVVEPPGYCVRLSELPFDHIGNLYIRGRGLDPIRLSEEWGVGYVEIADSKYMKAQDRIYIPVMQNGDFAGWQTRWAADPVPDGIAKYYSMPGMHRNQLLYNYDQAKLHPFVVICEGPSDVWAFGPEAVALFGKSMSLRQAEMIAAASPNTPSWIKDQPRWETVIILLDDDAFVPGKNGRSAVDDVFERLTHVHATKLIVRLPPGTDPGSFDTDYLRAYVAARVAEQGVKLPI